MRWMRDPSDVLERLARELADVRRTTEALAAPLSPEDMQVQSMPDASPTKWHLAHTTWFFETFVLPRSSRPVPFRNSYAPITYASWPGGRSPGIRSDSPKAGGACPSRRCGPRHIASDLADLSMVLRTV